MEGTYYERGSYLGIPVRFELTDKEKKKMIRRIVLIYGGFVVFKVGTILLVKKLAK